MICDMSAAGWCVSRTWEHSCSWWQQYTAPQ